MNRTPFCFHAPGGGCAGCERIYSGRIAHYIQKNVRLISAGQEKVETVSAHEIFHREFRREFVETCLTISQGSDESVAVFFCGINPEVNVLGKCRRAVEDGSLSADEQILNVESAKALEKACDLAPPLDQGDASASANFGATVPAESVAATRRSCKGIGPHSTSGMKFCRSDCVRHFGSWR